MERIESKHAGCEEWRLKYFLSLSSVTLQNNEQASRSASGGVQKVHSTVKSITFCMSELSLSSFRALSCTCASSQQVNSQVNALAHGYCKVKCYLDLISTLSTPSSWTCAQVKLHFTSSFLLPPLPFMDFSSEMFF